MIEPAQQCGHMLVQVVFKPSAVIPLEVDFVIMKYDRSFHGRSGVLTREEHFFVHAFSVVRIR